MEVLKKKTLVEIKAIFEKEDYELISTQYKNSITPLHSICPNKHKHVISYGNFQQGQRCGECQGNQRGTIEEVRIFFEKENYKLLDTEYNGNKTHIHSVCPEGHDYFVTSIKFKNGNRCPICSGFKKKTLEEVRSIFEKENYRLISEEYLGVGVPLQLICPKGSKYFANYSNFNRGHRCPCCVNSGTSKPEQELTKILLEKNPNLIKRSFSIKIKNKPHIHRFQVDIFDPITKRGIEYDGEWHHSEEYLIQSKTKIGWPIEDAINYHSIKDSSLMEYYNISLLHIKGEDWVKDKQSCINKCLEFLNSNKEMTV